MKFIKSHALVKRGIFKFLIGSFLNKVGKTPSNNNGLKKVLICGPNYKLENLLLLTPLVQELESIFPNCKIDLLVNQSCAKKIYKNYESVKTIFEFPQKPYKNIIKYFKVFRKCRKRYYDLTINAVENSSSGIFFTLLSNANHKFYSADANFIKEHNSRERHLVKRNIYALRTFLRKCDFIVSDDEPFNLDLRLDNDELMNGGGIVFDIVQNALPTICFFTNATGAKCYSESWWLRLYARLKETFPEMNIIEILPKEDVSKINFTAPTFYTKDIRELGAVIASADIFIGANSGAMHLASAVCTPTLGLFSIESNIEKYQPYNEGSAAIDTNDNKMESIIKLIRNIIYPYLNASMYKLLMIFNQN